MRLLYRLLRLLGDVKAIGRGPVAVGRRLLRRQAHRGLSRFLRLRGV